MATVTPVSDATPVQPDENNTLTEGNVTVAFGPSSRARTYQAALTILDCETSCSDGALYGFSVTLYNAEGEPEKDARLILPARITVDVDADTVSELGGTAVLLQAHALGGVSLLSSESDGESSANRFVLDIEPDGSAVVTAETRRIGGNWALALDAALVAQARAQLSAALGTPTVTPIPTVTPSPIPTATAVPTAAPPVMPAELPPTGDTPPPLALVLALTAAAALIALYGAKVISARARRRKSST